MATLALTVAGAALGNALLPAGISVLGATMSGAMIGSQIGALGGAIVDQALFGASGQTRAVSGPRLSDLKVTASTEGTPVPRLFGRARLGGQVIWATPLEEEAVTASAGGSGKGAPQRSSAASRTDYVYYASFAVAICQGPITGLGRVWADGQELDLAQYVWRLHKGTETQEADSLIVARQGAMSAPAYRGVAYIVFERMPLAAFGNRLPQLSFEVHRAVDPFEQQVRGVVMIPGSGEFVYAPEPVTRVVGLARSEAENTHTRSGLTDWALALDQLAETFPNTQSVSLVVSWFGSDLRAGHCRVRPAVDSKDKQTAPLDWSVAGLTRDGAPPVSIRDGRAAYGGTPSDQALVAAIRDLKARGYSVVLTPFILMDIPGDNTLPDPYTGEAAQSAYPWRGRITCDPAPGCAGTPDKTTAAADQIAAFVGTCGPAHFAISGDSVVYSGPDEWTLRRQILHCAGLAAAAGGVDGFVIGTELRALTQLRSDTGTYPFVEALVTLAADVKSILGGDATVTYAADWTEYFGHHPQDGSGDLHFHLDPLWSSPHIDAIGIDCYWPLSDWRDGSDHLDRQAGARSVYDLAYLKSNMHAGEGFDWYYASMADRVAQVRTPVTDGGGKPWVFRFKDLKSWWLNPHHNRPGGVESVEPTAWIPQSKPVWFTEIGCPAVDKGANQPNVFVDPKSAESALPYFSRGHRDDLMQRRYLQALHEAFDPAHPDYVAGANPVSSLTGMRMVDLDRMHVYAWDARPFPAFPANTLVWGDGANWRLGHWLNGRIAAQPLSSVVASLLESYGFSRHDATAIDGVVAGYVIDRTMSAREALQPLELAFFFDAVESGPKIHFRPRGAAPPVATLSHDSLVETKPGADLVGLTRAQETDLPAAARIAYSAAESDYRQAIIETRRLVGASGRLSQAELALVMDAEQAARMADSWLFETWAARERAGFTLPPSGLAIEPGDSLILDHAGREHRLRVTEVGDHGAREIEALSLDPAVYDSGGGTARPVRSPALIDVGPALGLFLDLPVLTDNANPGDGYVAAARAPWPGGVAFYRSPETSAFQLSAIARHPATTGVTLDPVPAGPEGRFDRATRFRVRLDFGTLAATTPLALFSGANASALQAADGSWEVLQFESAVLVAPRTYELSRLLRGQGGTERTGASPVAAGARFVLLDSAITRVDLGASDIGLPLNWRHGPADRDLGDASYLGTTHAFTGAGLRPLSPVHIRGRRGEDGLHLTWVRRTRIGGDSWNVAEVPLAEDGERYEIDILSGADVVRTLMATSPSAVYTAADQMADFGAVQPSVTVCVAQVGATYGRGRTRIATV